MDVGPVTGLHEGCLAALVAEQPFAFPVFVQVLGERPGRGVGRRWAGEPVIWGAIWGAI
jgi:hypothetical protein